MTLVEFLLARITEDEADWKSSSAKYTVHHPGCDYPGDMPGHCDCNLLSRLLAECEAKRRIIELHHNGADHECWEMHRGVYGPGWPEGSYAVEGQPWAHPSLEGNEVHPGPCETLQLLALPYADHEDFQEAWRP